MNKEVGKLSLDDLIDVNGGQVSVGGYKELAEFITTLKGLGCSKEMFIQIIKKSWDENCLFKTSYTDQTDEDFQDVVDFVNNNW